VTVTNAAPRVALTIDIEHPDRPAEPGGDGRMLDALAGLGIRATFFVQGRWAEAFPAVARRIVEDRHVVGSHSFYHARLPLLSDDGLAEDVAAATAAIRDATGVDPRPWFRCPFGAGMADERVQAAIVAGGYRHVGWHVGCDDWEPGRTAGEVEDATVRGVLGHGDGAVVLLHSWPDPSAPALPRIADRLRAAGFTFVTIDELDVLPALDESSDGLDGEAAGSPSNGGLP